MNNPRRSNAKSRRRRRHGPAIPIAVGALLGRFCWMYFQITKNPNGVFAVLPGAIAGGIYYRLRSLSWPIDHTAASRRYGYAAISTLPLLIALAANGSARLTNCMLVISASFGIGILISGDRRPRNES